MNKSTNYLGRAWNALTRDEHWLQPMLVYSVVQLIPIIGPIAVQGYFCDWAKEAAWGLEKPLPRTIGDLGRRLKYGLYSIVMFFVWFCILQMIGAVLDQFDYVGEVLSLACNILAFIGGIIAGGATMRACIYDKIEPGLQIGRILGMVIKHPGGLIRSFCINLMGDIIVIVIMGIFVSPIVLIASLVAIAGNAGGFSGAGSMGGNLSSGMLGLLFSIGIVGMIVFVVVCFFCVVIWTLFSALSTRAYGYWIGDFEPQRWGRAQDQMPFEREDNTAIIPPASMQRVSQTQQASQAAPTSTRGTNVVPDVQAGDVQQDGAQQSEAKDSSVCPNCGVRITPAHKYCFNCGTALMTSKRQDETAAPEQSTVSEQAAAPEQLTVPDQLVTAVDAADADAAAGDDAHAPADTNTPSSTNTSESADDTSESAKPADKA